jgi:RNA polymerase sigma-70 factor, ECF subfamily
MRGVEISSPGEDGSSENSDPPPVKCGETPPGRSPRSRVDRPGEEAALACLRRGRRDEALKILMTSYGAPITAFAVRILRDRELAMDVRQQVFLQAFQGIDTFEGHSSLWSWLCGITYYRCLDELKRPWHTAVDRLDAVDDLVGPPELSEISSRIAKQRALECCLGKLPEPMRAQALMRYFFGLSDAEIGELVGDTPGTVQKRISRILPRLRRCLRSEGVAR